MALTQQEKGERFRALHAGEAFIIPNPWDAGSAKVFAALGFPALATTSSGFAFTLGRPDGAASLEEVCAHVAVLDAATDLPVSVDLENGYGPDPSDAATAIRARRRPARSAARSRTTTPRGASTTASTRSSASRPPSRPPAALDFPFTLTARAENHIRGNPDLDDTIARLQAYEAPAPTSCTRPGCTDGGEIRAVCDAVGKPVNVLAHKGLTIARDRRRRRHARSASGAR